MAITAKEYQEKFCKTKTVIFGDGVEFEIKKLSPIDMWDEPGKADAASFMRRVLLNGVLTPPLSIEDKDGFLNIRNIGLEHFTKLADEILVFSGYRQREEKDKGFLSPESKE